MNNHPLLTVSSNGNSGALKIAGLYLLLGALWILFSDQLAARIISDPIILAQISLYKGWAFILVTALLLYLLILRQNDALRGGEQQLRLITDALPALISYVDADKRYRFSNKAYMEWFGHEAQGKRLDEVLGMAAYKTISGYVERVLNGETVSYETQLPYKDGGARFVSATYVPDKGANQHVRGFFALVHDITESKQAEEDLRQWADAFEGCAHGIAIADPDTNRLTVCNPAFASLHKSRVEEVVGNAILSLYAPSDHENVRRSIEKADQIGHSRFEASMVRKDGSTFHVQMDVVSVRGEDGDLLHRVLTAEDISERKQAEEALRANEERYRIIFELTNDYAYEDRVEPDGNIVPEWITSGVTRITGYTIEDMNLPDFWQRLVHPEDIPLLIQHIEHILSGKADTTEIRIITKNGEVRWLQDSAHPIRDEAQGRVTRLYGAALDITERKRAEEALRESESNTHSLLRLSKRLEQAQTYPEALDAALEEVKTVLGYQNVWTYLLSEDNQYLRLLTITGEKSQLVSEDFPTLTIKGDKFLEEIAHGKDLVLVEDARIDPRTNKDIVAQLGNRTIVNVPIILMDTHLGAFGTGSFGEEGVRVPTPTQQEYLRSLASHMAVTLDRIHLLTRRKQAEEELRQSEERFSGVFRSSPTPIALTKLADGKIMDVNEAFCQLFGYTLEEIVGHTSLELGIADPESRQKAVDRLNEKGLIRNLEQKARNRNGAQLSILNSIETINVNGDLYALTTIMDITERKQAEEQLRYQAQLLANVNDAIIASDENYQITYWNPAAESVYGWKAEEVMGKKGTDILQTEFPGANKDDMLRSIRENGFWRGQVTQINKDGTRFPAEVSSLVTHNEQGRLTGFVSANRDITERKQVEEELRKSEERYRYLFENNPHPMWVYDFETLAFLDVNEAAILKYGFSRQEFLSMTIVDIRPPEDVKRLMENLAQPRQPMEHSEGWKHRLKDGTIIHVEITSHTIQTDGHESALVIAQDITERKQAEELAQLSTARAQALAEASRAFAEAHLDLQAVLNTTAQRVAELIGDLCVIRLISDDKQWLNVAALHATNPEALEMIRAMYEKLPQRADEGLGGQVVKTQQPMLLPEISPEQMRATIKPQFWPYVDRFGPHSVILVPIIQRREVMGYMTIMRHKLSASYTADDLTFLQDLADRAALAITNARLFAEVQQLNTGLEQRVIERTLQLQSANKELEAFSYSVSHDLRAPLRAIDGFTRILLEDYEPLLDDEGKRVCKVISREAQHMGQLIDDLLAFSRLGRRELHFTKIDMKTMASSVFDELVKTEDPARIDFHVHRLPPATGDPTLIRQAWVNLLSNALKFSSKKERAVIEIGSKHSEDEHIYYVRDNGAGFDMEYVDKLFGVFQRLHSERDFEGTGVGLAIVQQVVRRHGGRVWAEGEVDKGATFYFSLPRKRE